MTASDPTQAIRASLKAPTAGTHHPQDRADIVALLALMDEAKPLMESAHRLRLVWVAMAGKVPPDELQLAVALSDFTAHLNAFESARARALLGGPA